MADQADALGRDGDGPEALAEAMDAVRLDRILADATRLIAAPSENPGAGEGPAVEALAAMCEALGAEVMLGEVAPGRCNLHATLGGDRAGAPIMFLGHSDVVPAGEGWTGDPFTPRIEGDRLVGRGATDMKGGIAAVLEAMRVLDELECDHPIELLVTVDEEDRATGALHYLQHAADRELLALVVAEPTDLDTIVGCRGAARGCMLHSRGRRLPLRRLQGPQAVQTLLQVVRPPRERGTTWSKVRSWVGRPSPQYWHSKRSRRNTLNRVKAGRRAAGMYSLSAMTLGRRIVRLVECTSVSYSFSTETRSRKTAFTASCQDQMESGK